MAEKEFDGCNDDRDCKKDENKEKVELNEVIHRDSVMTVHMSPDVTPVAEGQSPVLASVGDTYCVPQGQLHKRLALRRPKDQLMCRANSLKKAFRQIIEHAEKGERSYRTDHSTGREM